MPTAQTSLPRPGPRPSTNREEIVDCAIRMLDREGPDALTFRAVARELDIVVGALSRYFKNLADLEDEVAARIMSGLRPLESGSKLSLRSQLVRLSMDLLELNRAHPYLLQINGPASAAVIARHTRQCLQVLLEAGLDFDRALALYALLGNLPYAWSAQRARQNNEDTQARIAQVYTAELGDLAPRVNKSISSGDSAAVYRRWLLIYIDGLLPSSPADSRKR